MVRRMLDTSFPPPPENDYTMRQSQVLQYFICNPSERQDGWTLGQFHFVIPHDAQWVHK